MKFLVVLALTFAVGSAAFTGSLLEKTKPLIDSIKNDFSVNLHAKSSAEVGLRGAFLDAIQSHFAGVIGQIQSAVEEFQVAALEMANHIQTAVSEIQTVTEGLAGSAQGIAGSLISSIQATLGNLLGGLSTASRTSAKDIFSHFQELLASLSLPETLQTVIIQVFGEDFGGQILNHLSLSHRGWWGNIWSGVTGVWSNISNGAQNLAGQIGNLASNVWNSISDKFWVVKEVVVNFIANGWNAATTVGFPAAQQLMNQMAPYLCQLGPLAATAASSLIAAYTGLTIPSGMIVTVAGVVIPGDHCP